MFKKQPHFKIFIIPLVLLFLTGCISMPKGFLKPSEGYLQKRQLQIRQFDTANEEQILTSVAGVLQDLGFTLDESETKLGLISASKRSTAVDNGQVAMAFFLDVLAGVGGNGSASASKNCDKEQVVKASVITRSNAPSGKIVVRVTFQRIVWNMAGQIKLVESIIDTAIYQKFYDALSKAIFLEAQQI